MKAVIKCIFLIFLIYGCEVRPLEWDGSTLMQSRQHLPVEELLEGKDQELIDMSYFARPEWAEEAMQDFSGTISFEDTKLTFPKEKDYYPGEDIFPNCN